MKLKFYFTFFAILLCSFMVSAQTNRALFVGIGKHKPGSGWGLIHGDNDWGLIEPMLKKHNYTNIRTLINEEATKANVYNALKNLCRQSGKGDYIYIHFSCHGQQVYSESAEEEDGLDEVLIMYDTERYFKPQVQKDADIEYIYAGRNHLRDKELKEVLDCIRLKTGPRGSVVVVFDACHSGDAHRKEDTNTYRGVEEILAPNPYDLSLYEKRDNFMIAPTQQPGMAPLHVYSACKTNESNKEYTLNDVDYGVLSYALFQALKTSQTKYTARKLAATIEKIIKGECKKEDQTPFFESTDPDKEFKLGR